MGKINWANKNRISVIATNAMLRRIRDKDGMIGVDYDAEKLQLNKSKFVSASCRDKKHRSCVSRKCKCKCGHGFF